MYDGDCLSTGNLVPRRAQPVAHFCPSSPCTIDAPSKQNDPPRPMAWSAAQEASLIARTDISHQKYWQIEAWLLEDASKYGMPSPLYPIVMVGSTLKSEGHGVAVGLALLCSALLCDPVQSLSASEGLHVVVGRWFCDSAALHGVHHCRNGLCSTNNGSCWRQGFSLLFMTRGWSRVYSEQAEKEVLNPLINPP